MCGFVAVVAPVLSFVMRPTADELVRRRVSAALLHPHAVLRVWMESAQRVWPMAGMSPLPWARVSLTGKKTCSGTSFPKKARGHSMCSTMVGGGWRLAVGGG